MAIHEWILMYGHVLTVKDFFQIMTNKSPTQFKRETEIANLLTTRYVFEEQKELRYWFVQYCLENDGFLPRGLRVREIGETQCHDANLPSGSLAIGYIFAKYEYYFSPLYPLENLQMTPMQMVEYEKLVQNIPHKRLAEYFAKQSQPKVLLLTEECDCC